MAVAERSFSPEDRARILQNKNVLRVGETEITYSPAFKAEAVRANVVGNKPPHLIFLDSGFDLDLIGRETPKSCLKRWRAVFRQRGEAGLMSDQRGQASTGRPAERQLTVEDKLRRAEARIRYLEKENELLKKLDAIERSVVDRPSEKYALIHDLVTAAGKDFSVRHLCDIADVSPSGYYRWLRCADTRLEREKADYEQHLLIKEIFLKKHGRAGWRVIRMNLERQAIIMNPKKIRRLMKKYDLITRIRRSNPYRRIAKATQEHKTAPNVLQRRFDQAVPYRAFGTDITYLYDGNGQRSYLSIILDMASGEVIAHRVSASLAVDLSLGVVTQAATKLGEQKLNGVLMHSDQGFHYTHPLYIKQLAKLGVVQSMSRKGNCLDNAPVESFFGHLKDEIDLTRCYSLEQVKAVVDEYIDNYNHHRYQWTRKKMAPVEYRSHLLTG
jgi:putative transposase